MDNGVLCMVKKYARGTDLRFLKDSFIIVAYMPRDSTEAKQICGRSSRTMATHHCAFVIYHPTLNLSALKSILDNNSYGNLKDGL